MAIQGASATTGASNPRPWRAPVLLRIATLLPFALALAIPLLGGPTLGRPMSDQSEVLGLPGGMVLIGVVLGWAAFGALVVWTTGSRAAATLAYLFITLPSIFALVLGPAIVLILQNLP